MPSLRDYEEIVGAEAVNEIMSLGERLAGRKIVHINSTKVGGGVAEILQKLIPLLKECKLNVEWRVIEGDDEFFRITKDFHNALHGTDVEISQVMLDNYLKVNAKNAQQMADLSEADFVIIHDPQPVALIKHFPKRRGKWIWRCHIDVSTPNLRVWEFLKTFVSQYNAAVFHIDKFAKKDLLIRQFIVPPSIDPLSPKNIEINVDDIDKILSKHGIKKNKPIISQIGRFDRLKDPAGVVKMYKCVKNPGEVVDVFRLFMGGDFLDFTRVAKKRIDCQLVLAGGLATDDPEGQEVYQEVVRMAEGDKDIKILVLPPFADIDINVIQRASQVVLQKSLKEGFALTVSEALWKGTPVVGGNAGGIPLQIIDRINGFLVNNIEEAADRVRFLLMNPQKAKEMGRAGREHVKKNFLITRHVRDHLLMYLTLELIPRKLVQV
ncbi:MAG: glycosyltransferase [Nitrososphaerales archaeon]|nr:glycosyltransferase [Nitrososphaerales archaeon]